MDIHTRPQPSVVTNHHFPKPSSNFSSTAVGALFFPALRPFFEGGAFFGMIKLTVENSRGVFLPRSSLVIDMEDDKVAMRGEAHVQVWKDTSGRQVHATSPKMK